MVSCREFLELFLGDWLDGVLPVRRRDACGRHVQQCRACAVHAADYLTTVRLLRGLARATGGDELPGHLVAEILRRSVP